MLRQCEKKIDQQNNLAEELCKLFNKTRASLENTF